jgi:hypothetical protein
VGKLKTYALAGKEGFKEPRLVRAQHIPEQQLGRWRKGHPFKIKLAMRLRSQTTVPLDWLAERLKMGTRGHLAHLLYRQEQSAPGKPPQANWL